MTKNNGVQTPSSWLLVQGDARHIPLADESVQCVVTSPPYWMLRQYDTARWEGGSADCDHRPGNDGRAAGSTLQGGKATTGHRQEGYGAVCPKCGARRVDAQLGLEAVPDCLGWATGQPCGECYVCHLVQVFREVKRVLRKDGTVWLVLGDSYDGSGKGHTKNGTMEGQKQATNRGSITGILTVRAPGLKPKDLCLIPARVALALQADGWYLRSDIIWAKGVSFRQEYAGSAMPESVRDRPTRAHEHVFLLTQSPRYYYDAEAVKEDSVYPTDNRKARSKDGQKRMSGGMIAVFRPGSAVYPKRNLRDVWAINPGGFDGTHFAVFSPSLVEPCIKSGTSEAGCCPHCGAAWKRTESEGFRPTCSCPEHRPAPCIVLDPFSGAGTTVMVANRLGRQGIGMDLSREYTNMARERIVQDAPLWNVH